MDIHCDFAYIFDSVEGKREYTCKVVNQEIPTNDSLTFSGIHVLGHQNKNVRNISFIKCKMLKIPQGLMTIFPNLVDIYIWESNLKHISKKDLAEYKLFKSIYIGKCMIEFLPGDLFDGFRYLEKVRFNLNRLKIIEPNILDGLNSLTKVNFSNNPNYKSVYSIYPKDRSNTTLDGVKNELNQKFLANFKTYKDMMQKEFENGSQNRGSAKKVQNQELSKSEKGIVNDLKNLIQNEKFKDFKIQVGDREFNVHKFLLIARSPIFAEIIQNNPDVENLNLMDVPVDIFEIILNFLYTDELPSAKLSDLRLFSAAGRLKIKGLKNFAAAHAMNQINIDNALEVLKLGNKYEHGGLRQKAFDKIKKNYPKIEFMDQWAMEPELVENIIENYKKKEEMIKKIEEEFKNELLLKVVP